jgi:metal-sulfur cluster biosynthetic enzyme
MQEQEFAGVRAPVEAPEGATDPARENDSAPIQEQVRDALKSVFDPELGLNIVDLGLVYEVTVDDQGGVDIEYTLTTMGCPIGPMIEDQMQAVVSGVAGVGEIRPQMVLRPAWTPEMMSDEAKAALGVF